MTSRQFGYFDCGQYIEAGHRWCYEYHLAHRLIFGQIGNDHFFTGVDECEWDQVAQEEPIHVSCATLFAVHQCRTWSDVEAYMQSRRYPVGWWGADDIMQEAQVQFARLTRPLAAFDAGGVPKKLE